MAFVKDDIFTGPQCDNEAEIPSCNDDWILGNCGSWTCCRYNNDILSCTTFQISAEGSCTGCPWCCFVHCSCSHIETTTPNAQIETTTPNARISTIPATSRGVATTVTKSHQKPATTFSVALQTSKSMVSNYNTPDFDSRGTTVVASDQTSPSTITMFKPLDGSNR